MRALSLLLVLALSAFPCFAIAKPAVHYATKGAAVKAKAITEGWVPDLLPSTSFNIWVVKNAATKESTGSFSFKPTDKERWHVQMHIPICGSWQMPPAALQKEITSYRSSGGSGFQIIKKDFVWQISCKYGVGDCKFWKWVNMQ